MRRRERFGYGGHAHRIRAKHARSPNFGRGFKLRAGKEHVYPLVHGKATALCAFPCHRAQRRRISLGHIEKARPKCIQVWPAQRACARELDMIGEDHHVARAVLLVYSARRIGEDERAHAKELEHAHRQNKLLICIPFIKMEPAGHADHPFPLHRAENEFPRVGFHRS